MTSKSLKSALLAATTALALVACGDSSTELASPGTVGPNPGTGTPAPAPAPAPAPTPAPTPTTVDPRHEADVAVGLLAEITVGNTVVYELSGTLTADLTLFTENLYQLNGQVVVGADAGADAASPAGTAATLTIEPGVTIYGADGGDTLTIARGSQINAAGTASQPITFTSAQDVGLAADLGLPARVAFSGPVLEEPYVSEWGGLIINGRATINQGVANGAGITEAEGEGDSGLYGGNDDADSSGTLQFVRVLYAGNVITSSDELNGIAFQGVGNGTTVENVQVHNNADDGVEFYGGTVNVNGLVVTGSDDDSIDWTFGWRGRVQNAIVIHNPNQSSSDQGIEADNQGGDTGNRNALPRSAPILSNMTLIGGGDVVGDIGILLREGTAAQIYNTVVTDFADGCFDVDGTESFEQVTGGNIIVGSTHLGCATPIVDDSDNGDNDLAGFFAGGTNNVIVADTLVDFVNGSNEASVTVTDVAAIDSFFTTPSEIGAVASTAADDNFTQGWTIGLNPAPTCPAGTTSINGGTGCVLSGNYSSDVRLRAGLDYFLDGIVTIGTDLGADAASPSPAGAAASLIVDAGVTVTAQRDRLDGIYVQRGSRLITRGTPNNPVVFTAALEAGDTVDNLTNAWGGIVINGRATINQGVATSGGIVEAEGEGDSGLYGGNDDTDTSGSIRYTRVEYAGRIFTGDDELNAIAFQGVGSGTEVEGLQTHNGGDDGIEFFGGTVNVKNLVITGSDDDSIDWTFGWRGKLQNAIVVHNPNQTSSDQGIEADNQGGDTGNRNALPRSAPILSNLTLVGGGDVVGDIGILLREGTAAQIYNTVVTDFADGCFDVDGTESFEQVSGGNIIVGSTHLGCATPIVDDGDNGDNDLTSFFNGGTNNVIVADTLVARTGGTYTYINGANEASVTVTDVAAINSFFSNPTEIGAVPSTGDDFTIGWTVFIDQ